MITQRQHVSINLEFLLNPRSHIGDHTDSSQNLTESPIGPRRLLQVELEVHSAGIPTFAFDFLVLVETNHEFLSHIFPDYRQNECILNLDVRELLPQS